MRLFCLLGTVMLACVMASVLAVDVAHAAVPAGVRVVRQDIRPGGFWLAEVPSGSAVTVANRPVPVVDNRVLVGFDRFAGPRVWVKICPPTPTPCGVQTLVLEPRTYATQNVKNIAKAHVNPDPVQQARMARDNAATAAARRAAMAATIRPAAEAGVGFAMPFVQPAPGAVTGVYGSRRAYNGQERSWHKGIDFANPTGTPVVAPADAVVRLARDTFMSGNLIMLDHGAGLTTVYAHLSRMDVQPGQLVKAGERLGAVGTTGRSSGPHLHWGMYWHEVAIDPAGWLPPRRPANGVARNP